MAYGESGGYGGVIPDLKATGGLEVEFSRNPKSFPLNRYSELRPVARSYGFYSAVDPTQAARVQTSDARQFAWAPGANRPTGADNRSMFTLLSYRTQRYSFGVPLDELGVEESDFQVSEVELRKLAQQAMTARTYSAAGVLTTTNWGANTSTVSTITGGPNKHWGNGTVANPYIQQCIQFAQNAINIATVGLVQPSDLCLVMSPDTAIAMSQSGEVKAALSNSVYAYPQLIGQLPGFPSRQRNWGLPPMLYDTPIAIEDTVVITSNKGAATNTATYPIPKGKAYLLCRGENDFISPDILAMERGEKKLTTEQREAVRVYSTLIGFFREELTVEGKADKWNRILQQAVASNYQYVISSPLSGFEFTATFT